MSEHMVYVCNRTCCFSLFVSTDTYSNLLPFCIHESIFSHSHILPNKEHFFPLFSSNVRVRGRKDKHEKDETEHNRSYVPSAVGVEASELAEIVAGNGDGDGVLRCQKGDQHAAHKDNTKTC